MQSQDDEEIIEKDHDEQINNIENDEKIWEIVNEKELGIPIKKKKNNDEKNNIKHDEKNNIKHDKKIIGRKHIGKVLSKNRKHKPIGKVLSKKCNYCERAFSHISILKIHIRSHTGEKPYICSQCGKAFSRNGQLKVHMKIHSGEKPYQCSQCGKSFVDNYKLISHMRTHTGEKLYQCNECDKTFAQSGHLTTHMKTHTGEKPYKCDQCNKAFLDNSSLKKHMRTHTGEKPYQCNHCGKAFSENGTLKKHMKIHTGERPYQCNLCDKAFTLSSHLRSHLMTHSGERPHKCNQCEKAFTQISTLQGHLRTHSGEKPFKCNHCDKAFSQSSSLKGHRKKNSDENGILSCVPEEKISDKELVKIPPAERPYKCTQCNQAFTLNSRLKSHMWIHSGEKPYKCSQCDRAFSKSKRLNWHLKMHANGTLTKHMLPTTVPRPHQCNQCDNSFSRKSSLKRHMMVHSGEEPYTINKCKKVISDSFKGNPKKHAEENEPTSPWDVSDEEYISEGISESEENGTLSHIPDNKISQTIPTPRFTEEPVKHNININRKFLDAISTVSETLSHGLEHPEVYLTMFNTSLSQLGHQLVTIPESALDISRNLHFSKKTNPQLPGSSHSIHGHLNIRHDGSGRDLSCISDSKTSHSIVAQRYTEVPTRPNANESSKMLLEGTSIVSETLSHGLENPEVYVTIFNKCLTQLGLLPVIIPESVIDISRNLYSHIPTLLPASTTQQFNMLSHTVMPPSHHPNAIQSRHGPYQPPPTTHTGSRTQPPGPSLPIQPNSTLQNNSPSLAYLPSCPTSSHPNNSYSPPIHNSNNSSVTSSIMLFASTSYQPYPPHTNHAANTPPWN